MVLCLKLTLKNRNYLPQGSVILTVKAPTKVNLIMLVQMRTTNKSLTRRKESKITSLNRTEVTLLLINRFLSRAKAELIKNSVSLENVIKTTQ